MFDILHGMRKFFDSVPSIYLITSTALSISIPEFHYQTGSLQSKIKEVTLNTITTEVRYRVK